MTHDPTTADHIAGLADALRLAMRGMAASVAVISTRDGDGARYAMAATAVTPLSMDPPSMLICVNRSTAVHAVLAGGAAFAINLLTAGQKEVAQACGGGARGDDRFAIGAWIYDPAGVPCLADAQAIIICDHAQIIGYGSHDVVIGAVRSAASSGAADPLLYADGAYRKLGPAL